MKEVGGEAAVVSEVAPATGATPAAPPLPVPVLAYAQPERRTWTRHRIWTQLAIPMAVLYATTTAVLTLAFLGGENPKDNIRMMLASLAFTAPLGIIAFIVGVLGHFSLHGRRLAGPAVWIVAITPGAAAAFTFFAGVMTNVGPSYATLTAAAIAAVDIIVVAELNGRILKASPEERAAEKTP